MDGTAVGTGMVDGAWGFVIIVYASTWLVVVGLAVRAVLAARGLAEPAAPDPAAQDPGGLA